MAENSWPTANGGSVTDTNYEILMGAMTGDGIVGTPGAGIVYGDSTGRQVKIAPGRFAIVRGFIWTSGDATVVVPIAANASGKPRIDRVVLRLDRNTFDVRVAVIAGTPATTPVAPSYQQTYSPSRYWDLPLANVAVASGATGVAAANVVNTGYYLAEPPVVSTFAGRPPVISGRIWRDIDHDRVYIGSENNTWQTMMYDSNWINMSLASGWKVPTGGEWVARLKNGWVLIGICIQRTGADLKAGSTVTLATLSSTFRPSRGVYTTLHVTNPKTSIYGSIGVNGTIQIKHDSGSALKKNALVIGQLMYPVNG